MSIHKNRKDEHVALAESFYNSRPLRHFDYLQFVHHSFPEINQANVSLETSFSNMKLTSPFYINGMTGGSDKSYEINRDLAIVARETGLLMASGSVSAGLKHPETAESYRVIRQMHSDGYILANLGPEHSLENAKRAIELLEADGIQIHVNAPQELVMPEGERQFEKWLTNIATLTHSLDKPVIVKEVGFGMSERTIQQLMQAGVTTVDISGRGGTNFVQIENARREHQELSILENWGQSTPISLIEAQRAMNSIDILASGGIQNPVDVVKALALGAKAVGVSGFFLHSVLNHGVNATIETVVEWQNTIQTLMTLLGQEKIEQLKQTDVVIQGPVKDWCEARQLPWQAYARRSDFRKS